MSETSRAKAVAAYKGVVRNLQMLPVHARRSVLAAKVINGSEYDRSWKLFESRAEPGSDAEILELFYRRTDTNRLTYLVGQLFPSQLDRKLVGRCLNQSLAEWVEQGHSSDDQALLHKAATAFLKAVEEKIRDLVLYVPVEGLEFQSSQCLDLGKCQLHRSDSRSEFARAVLTP